MIIDIDPKKILMDFKDSNLPSACLQAFFAFEIIAKTFGIDFIKREFLDDKNGLFFRNIDDPFFFHLSDLIWTLKDCKGFPEFIERERTKSKESLYYELVCASWFLRISDTVEFIKPRGLKGQDYDLLAKNCMKLDNLSIEVKTRILSFSKKNSIKRYLKDAVKQLPKDEFSASAIMFRVSNLNNGISQYDLDKIISKIIKLSANISYIIYLWPLNAILPDEQRLLSFAYRSINKYGDIVDIFPLNVRFGASYMKDIKITEDS
jgi:hypothetical protein